MIEAFTVPEHNRRTNHIERLMELSIDDATVYTFMEAWHKGHFNSFEDMICDMAIHLQKEKESYLKLMKKTLASLPTPSIVIKKDIVDG